MKKLRFSGQTALNAYGVLRDENDDVFDPALGITVTYVAANVNDYKVVVPELGGSGTYSVDVPANLPLGQWHVAYKHRANATALDGDDVVFQANFNWNGVEIVDDLVVGSSIADICNKALSHLSVGTSIVNLETDVGQEAEVLRKFYDTTRDEILRDFPWPFATRIVAMPLIQANPSSEWSFSYRYPSGALYVLRILSGARQDSRDTLVPYKTLGDDSGRIIYTDQEDAEIEYISRVSNPLRFTPDFVLAFSCLLAFYIAPTLTGGDPFKLGNRAMELYVDKIRRAQTNAANEETLDQPLDADMIRARE